MLLSKKIFKKKTICVHSHCNIWKIEKPVLDYLSKSKKNGLKKEKILKNDVTVLNIRLYNKTIKIFSNTYIGKKF